MNHHFETVLATSRKAHALPGLHALVHQAASRVLENNGDVAGAIAELELFLHEESTGPRADLLRKRMASLQLEQEQLTAKGQAKRSETQHGESQ